MKLALSLSLLTSLLGLNSLALAAPEFNCTIQTYNGRYLTAVGGGGRLTDVIHTDATRVGSWERLKLVDTEEGHDTGIVRYGIKTYKGNYLTAVGGGGRTTDVIHSDATNLLAWEKFKFNSLGYGWYTIETIKGYYLTAIDGGGRITNTIHSNRTAVGSWEKFKVKCTNVHK